MCTPKRIKLRVVGNYDNVVGAFNFMLESCACFCSSLCYVNLFSCTSKCKELGDVVVSTRDSFWLFGRKKQQLDFVVACENLFFANICELLSFVYTCVFVITFKCIPCSLNLHSTGFLMSEKKKNTTSNEIQTIDKKKGDKWTRAYEKLRRRVECVRFYMRRQKKVKRNR